MDERSREDFRDYVVAASPRLRRVAYLLTGHPQDAEDLVQTALAKTYLAWPRIRDREAVDAYVHRVMTNTRTSWWRRSRHLPVADIDDQPSLPHDQRDVYADADLHNALWVALSRLSHRQRAAVVLRYYEDLSEADTATALGVSVGTVKSTVSRALRRLRDDAGLSPGDARGDLPTELQGATS